MNILVSNDDGVFAPGIQALAQALKPLGRVVIVAPESERSGFSSALTLDRPLRPIQISPDVWAVNGTPADCVYLAMNGLFDFEFDLVVSGINSGANLGDDILYSGTVGAAFEGRLTKWLNKNPDLKSYLNIPNSYQYPVAILPIVCASIASGNNQIRDLFIFDPETLFNIKLIRDFDHNWFNPVYSYFLNLFLLEK